MSLRWRIALGFALVALATAAVIALATPPIVQQGFSDIDTDKDADRPAATVLSPGNSFSPELETDDGGPAVSVATTTTTTTTAAAAAVATAAPTTAPAAPAPTSGQAEQTTILRLLVAVAMAASAASLIGLWAAGRLVRPLTTLEQAAAGVARGDLGQRSGLADRSDEFGQLGRTFDSMAGQLELAEETRRRFLQDSAHELKTPLAVIEATSSAMIDGVYTPERRHLETIRDQSRILARIVDDLRTISLAEGGHLPLQRRPLDVRAIAESVAAGFEARAAASSIGLSTDGPSGLLIDADPDRLRQIIGALVDNALRHTPAGGSVRLVVSPVVTTPGIARKGASQTGKSSPLQPLVRIAIEDSGTGIPADALPSIFERFYQADPSRSRGTGTSGLGLSIVKALAEAHGGRAGAENRAEGGARLWIELPALRLT
jgi:two-component system, OmpR family, sensor histidine kinase BaeS